MDILSDYEKAFSDCIKSLSKVFKESFEQTEKYIGRKMTKKERDLCLNLGLLYFFCKFGGGK